MFILGWYFEMFTHIFIYFFLGAIGFSLCNRLISLWFYFYKEMPLQLKNIFKPNNILSLVFRRNQWAKSQVIENVLIIELEPKYQTSRLKLLCPRGSQSTLWELKYEWVPMRNFQLIDFSSTCSSSRWEKSKTKILDYAGNRVWRDQSTLRVQSGCQPTTAARWVNSGGLKAICVNMGDEDQDIGQLRVLLLTMTLIFQAIVWSQGSV